MPRATTRRISHGLRVTKTSLSLSQVLCPFPSQALASAASSAADCPLLLEARCRLNQQSPSRYHGLPDPEDSAPSQGGIRGARSDCSPPSPQLKLISVVVFRYKQAINQKLLAAI
mmetsp:Transcript_4317/g.11166  ORF Transcript_4317/g.11166 Transcript_4317/m.11166 type:complete len:115 (+) Transcript_4317:893-1237(+)